MTPDFLSAVEDFFANYMATNHAGIPFFFENSKASSEQGLHAVIHILPSEDVLPTNLGITSKSRNVGLVQVDVYGPKDIGAGPPQTLAYQIGRAFKRRQLTIVSENGHCVFKDHSVQSRGEVRGRHKEQMRIPYRYDFQDYP